MKGSAKKLIPYFLLTLAIIGVGFFSGSSRAEALDSGICSIIISTPIQIPILSPTGGVLFYKTEKVLSQIDKNLSQGLCNKNANLPGLSTLVNLGSDQLIESVSWTANLVWPQHLVGQ